MFIFQPCESARWWVRCQRLQPSRDEESHWVHCEFDMIWYYTFRNWQYAHWVSCISVFDMNWWDLWSGVEDCSPPSVWCKTTQRRHRSDDHLESCWWGVLVETSTKLLVSSFTISSMEAPRRQNKTILFSFADLQHPYVSPACFPSCQQQFDHVFSNGTGARFRLLHHLHNWPNYSTIILSYFRCWTAGWGKDEFSGSFQFIQHKVGSEWKWPHRKMTISKVNTDCWKSRLTI